MATKKSTATSKPKGSSGARSRARVQEVEEPVITNNVFTDIILWLCIAVSGLLALSLFGIGGIFGEAASTILFGFFGIGAYIFPFAIVGGAFFAFSNQMNKKIKLKMIALVFVFVMLCTVVELFMHGDDPITPFSAFVDSHVEHTGGGFFGACFAWAFHHLFGSVGAYVVSFALIIIGVVVVLEKSPLKDFNDRAPERHKRQRDFVEEKKEQFLHERELRRRHAETLRRAEERRRENEKKRIAMQREAQQAAIEREKTGQIIEPASFAPAREVRPQGPLRESDGRASDDMNEIRIQDFQGVDGTREAQNQVADASRPDTLVGMDEVYPSATTGLPDNDIPVLSPINGAEYGADSREVQMTVFESTTPVIATDAMSTYDNNGLMDIQDVSVMETGQPLDEAVLKTTHSSSFEDPYDLSPVLPADFDFAERTLGTIDVTPDAERQQSKPLSFVSESLRTERSLEQKANESVEPDTAVTAFANEPDATAFANEANTTAFANEPDTAMFADEADMTAYANEADATAFANESDMTAYANEPDTATFADEADMAAYANEADTAAFAEETFDDATEPAETTMPAADTARAEQPAQAASHTARTEQPAQAASHTARAEQPAQAASDTTPAAQEAVPKKKPYKFPPLTLLKRSPEQSQASKESLQETSDRLQQILKNFGVDVQMEAATCGPTVTRYELKPAAGVKVSKIVNLADDIKLNLAAADIRIEAPIPGKQAVGIEVPNKEPVTVAFGDLMVSKKFREEKSGIAFAAGKDIGGDIIISDIAKMPHLLIAGATGSGKSVCINTIIMSILYKATPENVKMIMIDPKVVELSVYNGIPHLLIPVVTDPKKATGALNWAVNEMMKRYETFANIGVRKMEEYNAKIVDGYMQIGDEKVATPRMPQIVIIVDELADLMMVASNEVEDAIVRLTQLARAAGIHLVIATQRPSVNVITGLIKANMPSRIAFSVTSGVDSRTILDMVGAEKLLGKGDMLYYPQSFTKPLRVQGAFVSDKEVSDVVAFIKANNEKEDDQAVADAIASAAEGGSSSASGGSTQTAEERRDDKDAYFDEAARLLIDKGKGSIGMLQRYFKIGFNRAARIMDQLSMAGIVGPEVGTKPREVIMTLEEYEASQN